MRKKVDNVSWTHCELCTHSHCAVAIVQLCFCIAFQSCLCIVADIHRTVDMETCFTQRIGFFNYLKKVKPQSKCLCIALKIDAIMSHKLKAFTKICPTSCLRSSLTAWRNVFSHITSSKGGTTASAGQASPKLSCSCLSGCHT